MIDDLSLSAYRASVAESITRAFAPWSRMPPEVWAEEIYRLPNGRRFRWSYAPYARGMFRSIFDRRVVETVFQLYSRGLKSTVALIAIGYLIDQTPRRILSLWPTIGQAEKWSKEVLCGELLDTTAPLNYLGTQGGKRNGSNTILNKQFPGGLLAAFGANSPGEMRRAKGSFLYGEEIDAMEETASDEGDQLAIFHKRGDEYPDTIKVTASYPSVKGKSRINARLLQSDHSEWFSTCLICGGEPFVMHRSQIRFTPRKPQDAMLECPRCKDLLTDDQRYAMAHHQGFDNWRAKHEFAGRRGFQANAMLWPHPVDRDKFPGGWLQCLAQQQIDAEKSENPKRSMMVLVNTVDAEPFDATEETEAPPAWKPIFERRENYSAGAEKTFDVPAGGLFLTATIDCQLNRLELLWRAHGRNGESWGLDHVVLDGHVRDHYVWDDLRKELQRTFAHEFGCKIGLGFALIDAGKSWGDHVPQFFRGLSQNPIEGVTGKVKACKGIGRDGASIVHDVWGNISGSLKGVIVGVWEAKDTLYNRFRMVPAGWEEKTQEEREKFLAAGGNPWESDERAGKMHWNMAFKEPFFPQLVQDQRITEITKGGTKVFFKKLPNKRREALDMEVYAEAAVHHRPKTDSVWDRLEAELRERAELEKQGAKPKPRPVAPPINTRVSAARGGW